MSERRALLEAFLRQTPAALALVRAREAELFRTTPLSPPVLDVGCGDGLFVAQTYGRRLSVGLDLSPKECRKALEGGTYDHTVVATAGDIPFAAATFGTVISNCVFEHVVQLSQAFGEINRVLQPGGMYIFTAHSHHYPEYLFYSSVLKKLGLLGPSRLYGALINGVFKHFNCQPPDIWTALLKQAGFEAVTCRYYLNRRALQTFDMLLPLSLPAYLVKALFGRWWIGPRRWLAPLLARGLERAFAAEDGPPGAGLFIVARKPQGPRP